MGSAPEDDFQQFLDMSSMGEIAHMGNMHDSMAFDFNSFQDPAVTQPILQQNRDQSDTIMGETGSHTMIGRGGGMMPDQTPPLSTGPRSQMPVSQHMMPMSTLASAPTADPLGDIDAQIQYLQQQKFQQQQRMMQNHQATYYGTQSRSVPPTPQSIEIPPGSGRFYPQTEHAAQGNGFDSGFQQRLADQHDVSVYSETWTLHDSTVCP